MLAMMPMLYSKIHSLVYRGTNKIKKRRKRQLWNSTPAQAYTTLFVDQYQLYEPQMIGPSTLVPDCVGGRAVRGTLEIIKRLGEDPYLDSVRRYYEKGLQNFGDQWVFADIGTVLYGISKNIPIESYLEIGVRKGRSVAIVAAMAPRCRILGFDMWVQDYAGVENPGTGFVRAELQKVGFEGRFDLIDGDSKTTVPKYFSDHPEAYFDLVTVDGDHSIGGAVRDLKNVIPRIKVGGLLVFDDLCSYEHPYLIGVWNRLIARNERFAAYSFTELGLGIGFAIKKF